jgi:hypothetical protein
MLYTKWILQEGKGMILCTSIVMCNVGVDLFAPSFQKELAQEGVTLGFSVRDDSKKYFFHSGGGVFLEALSPVGRRAMS